MKRFANVENLSHEEWLSLRRKGIGGSDVGSILGYNPYSSAFDVWADKTGRKNEIPDNEAMRQGRDFEQYVAERFTEATGKKVRRSNFMYQHNKYPFMLANVDRLIVGEKAGLECKTSSIYNEKLYSSEDIPSHYYCQCMHYMAVTGLDRWYLAVLIHGRGFHWFTIERDESNIKVIEDACADFWKLVESNTPPQPDGSKVTTDILNSFYSACGDRISLDYAVNEKLSQIMEHKSRKTSEETAIKQLENEIKMLLGENIEGVTDQYKVLWKPQISKRIDSVKLKNNYPDIYNTCLKESSSRPFKIQSLEV